MTCYPCFMRRTTSSWLLVIAAILQLKPANGATNWTGPIFVKGSCLAFEEYPLVICYIAIENHHRNSEFSHEKWWIFPVRYVKLPEGNHGYKWSWPGTRVHRLRSALRLYHLSTASPFTAASDLGDGMTAHPISGTQKTDSSHIELDISRYHMLHL